MGASDDTTVVRTYLTRQAAEFGKMLLEGSGVPSFLRADDSGGWRPYMTIAIGVRLVVRAADFERANAVLEESAPGEEPSDPQA